MNFININLTRPIVRSCSTGDVHEVAAAGPIAVRSQRDYREFVRGPTPPPIVHNVIERAPTPDPDIYERVCIYFWNFCLFKTI